jgi:hypothetical protein
MVFGYLIREKKTLQSNEQLNGESIVFLFVIPGLNRNPEIRGAQA